MAVLRWGLGGALVALFLLTFAVPERFRHSGQAASQSRAGQRDKRVYTNDDYPFNQPRSASSSSGKESPDALPASPPREGEKIAPFVPTPMKVVEKMLEIARVTSNDIVYDMGSGDGRIVILAAQKYGAKSVGVELDRNLAQESQQKAREMKLDNLVTIIQGDLLQTNVTPATVVAVYLLLSANDKLRPILEKNLKPGTRVVAHDIRIPGWEASREEAVTLGGGTHFVYLYQIPDAFRKQSR